MFFNSNDVFKLITCQVCQSTFDDPRLLPCSHTFCARCIKTSLFIKEDSTIECRSCGKKHVEVSFFVSSYPVNDLALELIRLRPREVSQSDRVKELKEKRALLAEKVGQLKHSLHIGIDEVKNYCANLKLEIDLQTESRLEEIRAFNVEMKQEVDDYERKCAEKFDVDQSRLNKEKVLADYEQLNNQTDAYLERFELTDNETKQLIARHESMYDELEISQTFLKSNKFNSLVAKFEKSDRLMNAHDCLGKVVYECNTESLHMKESLKPLTTLLDAIDESTTHLIKSRILADQYFAAYVDKSNRISLARFDSEIFKSNVLVESRVKLKPSCISESDDGLVVSLNIRSQGEQKFVISNQEICLNSEAKHLLVKFDHNLNYLKHLVLNERIVLTIADSVSMFYLEEKRLVDYSFNLEPKYHIPIGSSIPSNLTHIQCSYDKLFILYQKDELMQRLRVVNSESDIVYKEIDLYRNDFEQIKLIGNRYLALFSKATMTLNIYCQKNLNLINTIKLDLPDGDWSFSYDSSDTFISLVDRNGKILTGQLRVGPEPSIEAIPDADSTQNTQDQSIVAQPQDVIEPDQPIAVQPVDVTETQENLPVVQSA